MFRAVRFYTLFDRRYAYRPYIVHTRIAWNLSGWRIRWWDPPECERVSTTSRIFSRFLMLSLGRRRTRRLLLRLPLESAVQRPSDVKSIVRIHTRSFFWSAPSDTPSSRTDWQSRSRFRHVRHRTRTNYYYTSPCWTNNFDTSPPSSSSSE